MGFIVERPAAAMSRGLALLLCVLPLGRLMAMDGLNLAKACHEVDIILVVQIWTKGDFRYSSDLVEPTFPDSAGDIFKGKGAADAEAVTDALIRELREPLAKQGFHIFRTGGALWVAPQEAPPLFGLHLNVATKTLLTLDGMIRAFAEEGQCVVPVEDLRHPGTMTVSSISLEPGEYSLAQALVIALRKHPDFSGWRMRSSELGHSEQHRILFDVHPYRARVLHPPPAGLAKTVVRDLLLRMKDLPQ
jgi:hypothetical protein